jgi:hypothetical protein
MIVDTIRAALLMGRLSLTALLCAGSAALAHLLDPKRNRKRQMEFPWKGLS